MPRITLYNALNGLSTIVDCGQGLRSKSWLEEISIWLKSAAEPTALAGIGLGRLANYPAVLNGSKMSTRAMGEALVVPAFVGAELFEVVRQTQIIGIGTAASAAMPGVAALTQGVPAMDNYATAGAASGTVCTPINGVGYPAFITSNAENYNLAATDGVLSVVINGVTFTAAVGLGTATTAEAVLAAIHAANWPCRAVGIASVADGIDQVRLLALNPGRSSTMQAVVTAGTAGAVIFAAETGVVRFGWGGPLNDLRLGTAALGREVPGVKPQRRILPGSLVVTTTTAGGADSMTDNRLGVLSNLAGTSVGTIVYATGAITCTWAANVAAATNILARFGALIPLELSAPVRVNTHNGGEYAIRLLP
jgi:hypothetical protein